MISIGNIGKGLVFVVIALALLVVAYVTIMGATSPVGLTHSDETVLGWGFVFLGILTALALVPGVILIIIGALVDRKVPVKSEPTLSEIVQKTRRE